MAGAGTYSGNNKLGSLGQYVATILPDREGNITPDPPGTFKCTTTFCSSLGASDTITIMYVPPTSAQTTIRDDDAADLGRVEGDGAGGMPAQRRVVRVQRRHAGDDLRRHRRERHLLDHERAGRRASPAAQGPGPFKGVSRTNTFVTQIAAATYWLKTDTVAETYQLMRYDGYQTDAPIAENIVGMAFEYFADPSPPFLLKSVTDPIGPWTNYGPKPPAVGVNVASDNWGAGENCLFMVSGGAHVPRTEMATPLGPVNGPLVKLSSSQTDRRPVVPGRSDRQSLRRRSAARPESARHVARAGRCQVAARTDRHVLPSRRHGVGWGALHPRPGDLVRGHAAESEFRTVRQMHMTSRSHVHVGREERASAAPR